MGKEQYALLVSKMADIVNLAEKFDKHLQPTIVDWLCAALIADSSRGTGKLENILPFVETTEHMAADGPPQDADWDFRSVLIEWNGRYDLSRNAFNDPEFAALVAFVVKDEAPYDQKNRPITKGDLEEACRAIDRKIPSQSASTLSTATARGLLDKVKRKPGYTLAPKGENRVRDLLKAQDK